MRPHGSPIVLEQRRLEAITLLSKGMFPVDVAKRLGVDRRSVRRWNATYRKSGQPALKARDASGRPLKLTARQLKKLENHLIQGPRSVGFPTELWTCPRVTHLIRKEFNVSYHVDHIGRLLHALGWSPQKPERRAIERDEKSIRNWVRHTWPHLKKKPKN